MDIKKVLMGEKMPDKNDPQYREQYEREQVKSSLRRPSSTFCF